MMQTESERKKSQRERTAKHREKMKARSANDVLANEQKRFDQFNTWRSANQLIFPGEIAAGQNAETVGDALQVAREFLISLNQPDVQPGESLLNVERRSVEAWAMAGFPLLCRDTLLLDFTVASTDDGFVFSFDRWIPIAVAHDLIDISTLPIIVVPEIVEAPAAPPAPQAPQWDDPALRNYRTPEVAAIIKITQDAMDVQARKIAAANLERESLREKKFGIGYAYDAE
jgi:hypothetical protein